MPSGRRLALREPGAEHFVARRRRGIRALRRALRRLRAQARHGVVRVLLESPACAAARSGSPARREGVRDDLPSSGAGPWTSRVERRQHGTTGGRTPPGRPGSCQRAEIGGRAERLDAQAERGRARPPARAGTLTPSPRSSGRRRASPWSSDSAQCPNASASPVPIGTGSGNGINPLSSSSVSWEQAESMADGLPPVDRHSSEPAPRARAACPILADEIVRRLFQCERLQLVGREGGLREGERRAVGVVAPGEHQDRRDAELRIEHGAGDRFGQLLLVGPAAVEDQQRWVTARPARGPYGGHEELAELIAGRRAPLLAPSDAPCLQRAGRPPARESDRASAPRADREPHQGETRRLGDHGLDEKVLSRARQSMDPDHGAVPGPGVVERLLQMGALTA